MTASRAIPPNPYRFSPPPFEYPHLKGGPFPPIKRKTLNVIFCQGWSCFGVWLEFMLKYNQCQLKVMSELSSEIVPHKMKKVLVYKEVSIPPLFEIAE